MKLSRTSFFLASLWFGILTGLLESLAFLRFPQLANPDLPWIALLFSICVCACAGVLLMLLVKPTRFTITAACFVFALVMFYNVATVGVLDHGERLIMRGVALALSCVVAFVAWKYPVGTQNFHRRSVVWVAVIAALYAGAPAIARRVQEHRQITNASSPHNVPNVLVVIVDALRADHLSTYGYQRETSPHISQFASRGVLFRNAISAASWTLPSHASILTGRLPHEHQADRPDRYLDGRFPTVAEAFSARGYHTAAFSANWWLFARRMGFGRGFMHFQDFNSITSAAVQTNLGQRIRNVLLKISPAIAPLGRSDAGSINENILGWIDRNPGTFFIVTNYMDVHEPYTPPLDCFHRYSKKAKPSGQVFLGNPRKNELTPAEVQDEVDAYDASIACVDEDFSALIRGLKQRGLADNTVIVLTSDHGDEFNEHGLMSHESTLYRELVHVPLVVVGPGIPAGETVDLPVSQLNLPATLLALSGGDGKAFPGIPLNLAWAQPGEMAWPDPVSELAQLPTDLKAPNYYSALESVVTPKWQLIVGGKKGQELYRWPEDNLELHDLAPDHEPVVASLADELQRAEKGELAVAGKGEPQEQKTSSTKTTRKYAPSAVARDKNADRDKNNEYLKALGYIPD